MLNFKEYKKIHEECLELSRLKNQDYGCNSLKRFKNFGILVRISDKVDRLVTIFNSNEIKVKEEKVEDTLKDIINYATYMVMQQRNKLEEESNEI